MPYVVPTFNLLCNVKGNAGTLVAPIPPVAPYRLTGQICALVWGRRVNVASTGGTTFVGVPLQTISLLLPARTDIRGPACTIGEDCVECPAGSGRWYCVYAMDDIGRGWPNEHRCAVMMAIPSFWPDPVP